MAEIGYDDDTGSDKPEYIFACILDVLYHQYHIVNN